MVMVSTTSKDTGNQRGKAIAIALRNQEVQQTSRLRNAMVLLAIIAFGTAMAAHAHAAEGVGNASGGFGRRSFHASADLQIHRIRTRYLNHPKCRSHQRVLDRSSATAESQHYTPTKGGLT